MSNAQLQSQVSQLEAELSRIESYNSALRNEIAMITSGVAEADRQLQDYNAAMQNALENCNTTMNSSTGSVLAAYELQGEIEKLYQRFKHIELANKNIRACNNKKYYDFENFRTVRKIVQGLMDNLDVNMVSDETIAKSIEIRHLQSPDYWLTCVLISIMAWRNDDRLLADRAMERAIHLDKKNSSIFYMLFNIRMDREDAALKWFHNYQQCELTGGDEHTLLMLFSLVSKTVTEQIEVGTNAEIAAFIKKVMKSNAAAKGYSEEGIVATISGYFAQMKPSEWLEYTALKKYCLVYDDLADIMLSAKNNNHILQRFQQIIHVPVEQRNAYLKDYIESLVAAPNSVEEDVYAEIIYNEMVIQYEGDVEAAKEQFQADRQKAADRLNLIAQMIEWIYEREHQDINGQIRLNMFTLTKELQEKAVDSYVKKYRSRSLNHLPVQIHHYSTQVDFTDESMEKEKISDYFTERQNEELATIKNWKVYAGLGVGVAAAVSSYFVIWLLAIAVLGGCFGAYAALANRTARRRIRSKCQDETKQTTELLSKLFVEYESYTKEFNGYDELYEKIRNELRVV